MINSLARHIAGLPVDVPSIPRRNKLRLRWKRHLDTLVLLSMSHLFAGLREDIDIFAFSLFPMQDRGLDAGTRIPQ